MTTQNYLVINLATNVVDNCVIWDGNTNTWTPPANTLMLVQADTPAIIWQPVIVDLVITDWILNEVVGGGDVGFTWNTTTQLLTTNQPKPTIPV